MKVLEDFDEEYVICETEDEFDRFCEDGGWGDQDGFHRDTGMWGIDLLGRPFTVVHSRVYFKDF